MEGRLRKAGIDILGEVPWGTHFCQFYQTREDLLDILLPYFKAGLENNEFCMWVTSQPLSEKEALKAMRKAVADFDRYLDKGQIEILPHTEWYLRGDSFESRRVLNGWVDKLDRAIARGFDGLRLTGNTFWLEKEDWRDFVAYEEEVNNIIGRYPMIAMCTYSFDKCRAAEIIDVVGTHQFALSKREGKWDLIESAEHRRAVEALKESEARYRSLFENLINGFSYHRIITDEAGKPVDYVFVEVNSAFEKLTGLKRRNIIG
ncbi:MAG: MEDS domain-containing protein, partial [bacterium]